MNKQIISWGMMLAAAFTLTNCTKEIDNPNQEPETSGIPFELVATSVDTKTDNTAGVVAWSADDAINIFHAEATTDAYINDGSFTIQEADLNDGRFTGNLKEGETLSAEKYDWYAFYPYTSQIETPANTSKGWTPVGSKHNVKQAQDGYDNMNHISGTNYPLYGVAKNVASNDRPSITMNHAYSIAKIVVKNTTEQELTVETVSFTAPVNIVGTYYINFADESLTFTKSSDNYVSKTAELEVSNGTALQENAEAAFYIAFVPFTAAENETLSLSVNGYSKEIKLTKDVTFAAGKIQTLNFAYDKVEDPAPEGVNEVTISFATTDQRVSQDTESQVWANGDVTFTNNKATSTSNIIDSSAPVRLYKNSTITLEAPGNITQIEFTCNTSAYATALQSAIEGATVSEKVVTVTLDDPTTSVTYTMSGGQVRMDELTVTYEELDPDAPSITAGNVSDVSARGAENAELTYSIDNLEYANLTIECDGAVVTSAEKGDDGTIVYTVAANSTTSARTGTITINGGDVEKVVSVVQNAPIFTSTQEEIILAADAGATKSFTITSDFDWIAELSEDANFTINPDTYEWSDDGKQSVKVTANSENTSEEGTLTLGTITFTNVETEETITVTVKQESSYVAVGMATKNISFSSFTSGTQYAQGETHDLGDNFILTINGAHLNTQVRLYAGSNATVQAPGAIQSLDVTAGNKAGTLNVYGSVDGSEWTIVKSIQTTTSYTKYNVEFPSTSDYDWVKFESVGAQIRLSLLDITYQAN